MINLHIMKVSLYCPRCGSTDISVYKDTFECTICKDNNGFPLEFEKESIGEVPDNEILTIKEMLVFIDTFEELRNMNKRNKFYKSLQDDNLEN